MVTRFQTAIQQGSVDVTNLRNEVRFRASPGFRVVARPRGIAAFGSSDARNKAIARAKARGIFPASQFIGLFRLSNVGAFDVEAEKFKVLAGQKLAPATIRGLQRSGEITRQQASALATGQRLTTLTPRKRTVTRIAGVPFATKRQPLSLKEFGGVFAPRQISRQEFNTFSNRLQQEGKILDQRLKSGTASAAEVKRFNLITTQFNKRVSRRESIELRKFFKERPSPLKPVKAKPSGILAREFSDEITAADVFPVGVSIGSVAGRGVNIAETQKRVADFLVNLGKETLGKRKIPTQIERTRISSLRGVGSAIGAAFAGFETVGTAVALGGQEIAKGRTSVIAQRVFGPTKKQVQFFFSGPIANFIRENQNRDLLVVTNPLKAIKVTGNTAIITPTAIGRAGEAVFDIAIITGLGKSKIVALSKGKKPIGIIGKVGKLRKTAGASIVKRLKIKTIKKLARSVTRPVKVTKETRLLKEISKIQKNLRARKLRVVRPTKIKKLQNQVLTLREKFRAKDIFKPVPKTVRAAQKEIAVLKKIGKKFKPSRVKITRTGIIRKPIKLGARVRSRIRRTNLELRLTDLRTRIQPKTVFKRVPRTEKGLRLQIKKILAVEKSRFARGRLKIRLPVLQEKVVRLRARIKPLRILKPVPKTIRAALKEIKELEDIEKIGAGLFRGKIRVKNLQEQLLVLRQDFRPASILKPIPRTEKALLKEIAGLNRIRAQRGFRVRRKVRIKGLQEQLRLLKEKASITRRTKKLSFVEKARVNTINRRVKQIQTQVKKTRLKPKKIVKAKGRTVQIQKVRKKVKAKVKRKVTLTQAQASRFVSVPQEVAFVSGFARILVGSRNQFFGLTNQGVSSLVRGLAVQATIIRLSPRTRVRIKQSLTPRQRRRIGIKVTPAIKARAAVKAAAKFAAAVKARAAVRARVRARVRTRAITKAVTRAKIKARQKLKKGKKPLPILTPGDVPVSVTQIARSKGPFNVIVRRRGKRVKINKFPLTGSQALAMGGRFADNNAVRSFAILKTTGKTRKVKGGRFIKRKFRKPKGNTKLQRFFLVEKTKFLIDTKGEKRQITRKGILAPKRRKKRKTKRKRRKR